MRSQDALPQRKVNYQAPKQPLASSITPPDAPREPDDGGERGGLSNFSALWPLHATLSEMVRPWALGLPVPPWSPALGHIMPIAPVPSGPWERPVGTLAPEESIPLKISEIEPMASRLERDEKKKQPENAADFPAPGAAQHGTVKRTRETDPTSSPTASDPTVPAESAASLEAMPAQLAAQYLSPSAPLGMTPPPQRKRHKKRRKGARSAAPVPPPRKNQEQH